MELQSIEVPKFVDERGVLTAVDFPQLPFSPKRFYFIAGVPPGAMRGGHAHWKDSLAIFALKGAFTVSSDNGLHKQQVRLDQPTRLLLIPPLHWHETFDYEPDSICAVLSSVSYDPQDYCRDYDEFLRATRA